MNSSPLRPATDQAIAETLQSLVALIRDNVPPEDALARFRTVQSQHTSVEIDLLSEQEAFDGSVHYDALVRVPGEGTFSLSFCPERAVPWPLRGVHRWSDANLVRVNNTMLNIDEAITLLDAIWDQQPVTRRLVDVCLLREALQQDPIEVSDAELQRAVDAFRAAHGLHKAEDTFRWLEAHGLTHEQFERSLAEQVRFEKLRDRVAGEVPAGDAADRERAFEDWLSERRRAASVTWFWGRAQ